MADRELKVVITGDSKDLQRALKDSDKSTKGFTSSLKSMGKVAALGAGGAALGGLVLGLKSSIDAAKDAEQAQARLQNALENSGVSFKKHGKEIDDAIQKTSRLAAIDDEELSDSFSKLIRTSGNVSKSIEGIGLAADIARARNISLEAATKMVEKALAGQDTAFTRIGIRLKKNQDATDALTIAQERFGGAAEKYGKTAAGAQENLGVAFENLQETIGSKVLPIFTKLIIKLNEAVVWVQENWPKIQAEFQKSMDNIQKIIDRIKPILQTIIDQIVIVAKLIKAIVEGDWSEVWNQLKAAAVNAIKLMIQLIKLEVQVIFAALKALGKAALDGLEAGAKGLANVILDEIRALPGQILALGKLVYNAALSVGKKVLDGIKDGVVDAGSAIGGAVGDGIKGAINVLIRRINAAINFDLHIPGIGPIGGKTIHIGYTIPELAKGGIVTQPTLALIGEAGPEAVVPLGQGMGGGTNVFNFPQYLGDKRDLEKWMQQIMVRFENSNGISFTGRAL